MRLWVQDSLDVCITQYSKAVSHQKMNRKKYRYELIWYFALLTVDLVKPIDGQYICFGSLSLSSPAPSLPAL